jgi:acyl transferase domain-containing protein
MNDNINNLTSSQRILAALKDARARLEAVEQEKHQEVAIIGMAGRFPGANNVSEFWHNIKNGINSIQTLSDEELLAAGVKQEELENPNYVRAYASFLGLEEFDAAFFGYSPREAEILDPQHRIFLECAWEALENAGYDSEQYKGTIGVYGGAALNNYLINLYNNPHYRDTADRVQVVVSNVMGLMPTRVSYKLNLTGPSCGVQTGCSTSLVSVHLACQSLYNRECDIALAGGVSLGVDKKGYLYKEDGVLSPDGYCRAFDAGAKGTVFGNGVGIVVLKRLQDAIADNDYIYAVIKGTAINNDGSQKVGLTAPSVTGQAIAISQAISKAKIEPETIQYIETHGTGTALGDPIEIAALTKVFTKHTDKKQFCAIGSVKTNIGHLDAAAGVTSLIKVALALKDNSIPPSLNFTSPNSQIDFANSPFFVNIQLTKWNNNASPKRAGVSSFGMGGTNAHAILEEAPKENQDENSSRPWHILTLSAKTASALETATANFAAYLQQHPDINIADVAYTLQIGRRAFEHRRYLVCQTASQAVEILTTPNSPQLVSKFPGNAQPGVVFMFPGQGSQYVEMGKDLYAQEAVFRQEVDNCCELLIPHLGLDLRAVLYPDIIPPTPLSKGGFNSPSLVPPLLRGVRGDLSQTAYTQVAIFVMEYALAKLWMSWGIQPRAMVGHSIGEYVAATLAGVFSLQDALMVVVHRGRLMQNCQPGVMLSVSFAAEKLEALLDNDLVIAVDNAPQLCVVSGSETAIARLEQRLTNQNIAHRRLHTSHAFHSPLMSEAVDPFIEVLQKIKLQAPQIPIVSNVTGTWMTAQQACYPTYWATHLRQQVKFKDCVTQIQQNPNQILLEVGFGLTLSTLVRQFPEALPIFSSGRHPKDTQSDVAVICKTLGQLWLAGVAVSWQEFYAQQKRRRLPLPTYPFERQRYWVDLHPSETKSEKQSDLSNWFYLPQWQKLPLQFSRSTQKQRYLVFANSDTSQEIVQRLQIAEQEVITVAPGESFSQEAQNYTIVPNNSDDYQKLWRQLEQTGQIPDVIIHSWTLGATHPTNHVKTLHVTSLQKPQQHEHERQNLGFYSLLWLTQAFSQSSQPIRICVLTLQTQNVLGTETLNPVDSTIMGLCKVIPQEYPLLRCQNIDLLLPIANWEQLVGELTTNSCDNFIAYRGRNFWQQKFEPITLAAPQASQLPLVQNGVYVIAGELVGGLGLIYANYLSQTVNAKLVFLTKAVPQPSEWETWLVTHGRQNPVSNCIQQLQGLRDKGCTLLIYSVDDSDITSVKNAITEATQQLGAINGVIHVGAMGDSASYLIRNLTRAECERQFQTKVYSLLVLEQALQNQSLDFFLLQSSLSAVVGGVGFAAYAGANIFMDTIAQQRSQNGNIPWISINWDAVKFEENATLTGAALIDLAMTPTEVWRVTERILAQPVAAQIAVSPSDLDSRFVTYQQSELAQYAVSLTTTSHARPNISAAYVAPSNDVESRVARIIEDLLGISPIGIRDNFFELGGHSLLAIQAVSQLREEFQVELPMRQFLFEAPTVEGIAKIITEQTPTEDADAIAALLEQVEQMSTEQVQQLLE